MTALVVVDADCEPGFQYKGGKLVVFDFQNTLYAPKRQTLSRQFEPAYHMPKRDCGGFWEGFLLRSDFQRSYIGMLDEGACAVVGNIIRL